MPNQLSQTKLVIANVLGTTFELYELAIYSFLAPIIASHFFPENTHKTYALINTFGIFFAGFLVRPIGAIFFGHIGDTRGRKKVLVLTMLMMSIATFCIGLLPTYHVVGLWAPILLVFCRGLQGFSFSTEYIGSLIFLMENSKNAGKGFVASWTTLGGNLGLLFASFVCWLLSHFLTQSQVNEWGWRIPFLLAIVGGSVGLYLRLYIQEIILFKPTIQKLPITQVIYFYKASVFQAFCLAGFYMLISYLLFLFSISYFTVFRHLSMSLALAINMVGLLFYIILIPFIAYLSDKIDRKPLLLIGTLISIIGIYPYYVLLQSQYVLLILFAHLGMVAVTAIYTSTLPVALAELVPADIRMTHTALGYNLAGLCVGGTTPLFATLCMQSSYGYKIICVYFIVWAFIAFIAAIKIKTSDFSEVKNAFITAEAT